MKATWYAGFLAGDCRDQAGDLAEDLLDLTSCAAQLFSVSHVLDGAVTLGSTPDDPMCLAQCRYHVSAESRLDLLVASSSSNE
jgi:hypothetical protein